MPAVAGGTGVPALGAVPRRRHNGDREALKVGIARVFFVAVFGSCGSQTAVNAVIGAGERVLYGVDTVIKAEVGGSTVVGGEVAEGGRASGLSGIGDVVGDVIADAVFAGRQMFGDGLLQRCGGIGSAVAMGVDMPAVAGTGDVYGHAVGASGGDIAGVDAASATGTGGVMVDGSGAGGEFDIEDVAAGAGEAASGADSGFVGSVLSGRAARPAADENNTDFLSVEVIRDSPRPGVVEDGDGIVSRAPRRNVAADDGGGRAVEGRNRAGQGGYIACLTVSEGVCKRNVIPGALTGAHDVGGDDGGGVVVGEQAFAYRYGVEGSNQRGVRDGENMFRVGVGVAFHGDDACNFRVRSPGQDADAGNPRVIDAGIMYGQVVGSVEVKHRRVEFDNEVIGGGRAGVIKEGLFVGVALEIVAGGNIGPAVRFADAVGDGASRKNRVVRDGVRAGIRDGEIEVLVLVAADEEPEREREGVEGFAA